MTYIKIKQEVGKLAGIALALLSGAIPFLIRWIVAGEVLPLFVLALWVALLVAYLRAYENPVGGVEMHFPWTLALLSFPLATVIVFSLIPKAEIRENPSWVLHFIPAGFGALGALLSVLPLSEDSKGK